MNNYSWLQQKLHHVALSSKFIREVSFIVESWTMQKKPHIDNNIFIAGLARSGTTALLNALYKSNNFATLCYQNMPFILAPNLWTKLSSLSNQHNHSIDRAHDDGIKISIKSPEAFEEVFWMTFDEGDDVTRDKFKIYIQLINQNKNKNRYLSKNNQNVKRLELISNIFPQSKILILVRDPLQTSYSLLSQHRRFIDASIEDDFISNYMKWIGHTEFGPNYIPLHQNNLIYRNPLYFNHWLEQWYLTYHTLLNNFKDKNNIYFICYEKLCLSKSYWNDLLSKLSVNKKYNFKFIESRKDINLEIDTSLRKKASSLYLKLFDLS